MVNYLDFIQLGRLICHFEPQAANMTLHILTHEHREEIARKIIEGLLGPEFDQTLRIETSSGEYTNEIAILQIGKNKYTFEKDHQNIFISKINHYSCRITAGCHGILAYHTDYPGVIRDVSRILAENQINISSMKVSREHKGKNALLVSLTDEEISTEAIEKIEKIPQITKVVALRPV
ncbi:ACT domain-containing protein [Aneurinibacillus aneurinilyticus]|uniref:ACT domain protein n=1 Tax=Aneurinibacillus aneurinilyticus ATCC 12856 TaxID=649747 RepID=U1WH00_ANEAE|nr:ACT domain-containing protein [Aneurinibacillus aneurinilyticus]ERI07834.1 ACT domain protein [Aneurinibacillus aneurinilyticus ATCC 12856]MED0706291.1 ACT domain-containing protein [Aneurinibacillus aneurinilyticus]MED0725297.1 ACT domain-containing protein [Aneurinibacillus aneurinilyticus]MED0732289.1 ACT domain-containing protein [Aneurinibacillus aneurinilyticus]MED0741461.1 ACT domain-containing protein [Aneurinibacillus aneurinilyticus]